MKTVFYYTSAYVLDISLEIINALKDKTDLHVFIEVTQNSKKFNILEINQLPTDRYLAAPEDVLSAKDLEYFSPYFTGCRSVQFVLHSTQSGSLWNTFKASQMVAKRIRKDNPDVIHFESFSMRTIGLLPYLFGKKKKLLSIHDATPHTGENHWKSNLPRTLFMKLPFKKGYVFYSEFTRNQFIENYRVAKNDCQLLSMPSYSFFRNFSVNGSAHKHILFFGRISKYKGIPLLLDAMPHIWADFKDAQLVIAGGGSDPAVSQHPVLNSNPKKIIFLNRHISNSDLVALIKDAMVVICPYTDASQSGVLMTSFGLKKPVVATNVGAFGEFIKDGVNGFLTEVSAASIAETIRKALNDDKFKELEDNLLNRPEKENYETNGARLLAAYTENTNQK